MIQGIGHIGIVVRNIETALSSLCIALDMPVPPIRDHTEKKMKVAMVNLRGIGLEFLEDYSKNGEFARFVREKGNAIHHVSLLTDDIQKDIQLLESRGIEMKDRKPRIGLRGKKIAFTEPSVLEGIPLELSEP
jgi:methylmalonyl-CoA/ethylmalonyl-CoA epimerase